jgi:hypothetical protein
LSCGEKVETKFLCPACWELSAPPDPIGRCRHCFEEVEEERAMCAQCIKEPLIETPRAFVFDKGAPIQFKVDQIEGFAAFMIYQWVQLDSGVPDLIAPMPDISSQKLAKAFARAICAPYREIFREKGGEISLKKTLDEDLDVLLIDCANPMPLLQGASRALSETMPKKALILTLIS